MVHISLENISKNAWDKTNSNWDYLKGIGRESIGNIKPEAGCISACTIGEVLGSSLAYYGGEFIRFFNQDQNFQDIGEFCMNNSNALGIPFALALGSTWIYNHLNKDALKHGVTPSFFEIATWGATTESICAATAILIEYYAMNSFGDLFAGPLNPENLFVELVAFLAAFPIATVAMSTLTFPKKNEAGRIVTKKNKLYALADNLRNDYKISENYDNKNILGNPKPYLVINGENKKIKIQEKSLPQIYHKDFNPEINSLYRIFSSRAKYSKDAGNSAEGLVCKVFDEIGFPNHTHVKNPFAHDHSHKNS